MKKTLLLIAMMLCCATAILAQNNRISYQAVVRDTANRLVANKTVEVTVNIYNGDETTAAYTETQTTQTNYNGLIALQIGNGNDWASIDWKTARIKTTVKLEGTDLATLEMPLTAVPYALYAEYADELDPGATVVTNIYNKMRSDSLALGTLIDANTAEIGNLKIADANLSQRIVADSNKLVALQNRVNTFNTHVCDSVDACVKKIVSDTASALRGLIKATDDKFGNYYTISETDNLLGAKADTGWVYTRTVIDNKLGTKANASDVYTKEQTYSKDEVNTLLAAMKARIDSLANVTKNLPVMAQDSFTVATDGQDTFKLKNVPDADHVLRMYINGVMVGGSHSGVLTISSTNPQKVVYHPAENKNRNGEAYDLKAGDKVTVVYWYVKPATAITPGS